jgi:hypothetical protein
MSAKIGHKLSALRLSIAHEAGASDNTVERVAARKIETIPVTSGVLGSLIIPVENAIGEIQLYGLSFAQLRQAHHRLPYLWKHFDPNIQGKSLGAFDLYAAIYGRGIVNKRVASPFLWNNFHKHPVRKHVIGATFPDIFNGELHIARGKPLFNITSKGLEKGWGQAVNNDRFVLHPSLPSAYINIGDEIADTFSFCGFLGLVVGLALLLTTLCLDGTFSAGVIAIVAVVLSVFTFHLGLVALLAGSGFEIAQRSSV